jgi:putative oxidoreductase
MWLIRTRNSRAALVARLTLGLVMLPHGAQKALGWFGGEGLRAAVGEMSQQGIPIALSLAVVAGELLGSLALVVGLFGRLAAATIFLIMLGAVVLVHLDNGFFMNWTGTKAGEGFDYHVLAMGLALVVCLKERRALDRPRAHASRGEAFALRARPPLAHVGASTPDAQ